ncbi:MAG TPA: hypothetical protein ACHBY6_04205 [Arsenophonus apicola]
MENAVGLQRQIWQRTTLEQAQSHRTQQLVGLRSWIYLLLTTKRDWKVLTYNKYCFLSRFIDKRVSSLLSNSSRYLQIGGQLSYKLRRL